MTAPLSESGVFGPQVSLLIAPLIGVGFGWFLERGGLGDAPKLAAQFYLKDLRVFKVMFTALLTAMLGTFWLSRFGLLDIGRIAIPETYLAPQALGGVIFGLGFVTAGLCPGTSCVAASTGRLDGLGVMGGLLIGVAAFDLGYSRLADFYGSTPRGPMTLSDATGLPQGFVVALIAGLALMGFFIAERIERRQS
jgi:uncharacterized membrane protein YedE/YeeE